MNYFEEPENLLKQEVREPALYNAIVTVIAAGDSRMAEISTKVGENTSVCTAYLKNYTIDDNMFRFWYRFVPENTSIIARGASDLAYRRMRWGMSVWSHMEIFWIHYKMPEPQGAVDSPF